MQDFSISRLLTLWARSFFLGGELGAVLCLIGCLTASLVPLDASGIPHCDHQRMSGTLPNVPQGTICPLSVHQEPL